jgi:hypothetical protein
MQWNIQNQNNSNYNNITINIRSYGEEIRPEFLNKRLKEFNGKGISIHFNPHIPENHNIRKHDKQLLKVYEKGDWILRSFKSAVMDLMKRYKDPEFEKHVNCEVNLRLISTWTKHHHIFTNVCDILLR